MNDDPSNSIDHRNANELLLAAIQNPVYNEYVFGLSGRFQPLAQEQVDEETRNSVELQSVKELIGWPNEDSMVAPPYMYSSPSEFKAELFDIHALEQGLRDEGRRYDADILNEKELNNLNTLFRVSPAVLTDTGRRVKMDDENMIEGIYSSVPALIRAYVVAPDLMNGLHEAMKDVDSTNKTIELYEQNPNIVAAAYMAYRIMGRLVAENDGFLQDYINGAVDEDAIDGYNPVTSSHRMLTR